MSGSAAPPGHALGSPAYRRLQLALVCAGIACFAQLYSPQGILPLISADLGIGPGRAALTVSAATAGLALAVMPWSFVGDRIGRRRAMAIAVVSATLLALAAAWSPNLPLLLVLRFLEGAALGGVPALAMAYLAEEVAARARAIAAGWFVAGTTLGGLSGRILAAPVADVLGWRAGMTAVVLLAVVAAIGFTVLAPRERRFVPRSQSSGGGLRRLLPPLRDPGQLALLACAFLLMGGFVAVYNYLAFHLVAPPFGLPASLIGLLFLAYLGGTVSSPLAGRLADVHGRLPVMLGAMTTMLGGLLLTLIPWLPVLLLGLVLMTAGFFAAHSVASGWAGVRTTGARAQATGLYNLAYYAGSSVLGWAFGLVLARAGWGGIVAAVSAAVLLAGLTALALLRDEAARPPSAAAPS